MSLQDYDFGVNLSDIEESEGVSPIPPGEYQVKADQVRLKNTKNGKGKYLAFEFTIIDGAHRNRKIFQNVIVEHTNEDAKHIGFRWLKSWIMACNGVGTEHLSLSTVYRFLNQPCIASIIIEEGQSGYSDHNQIQRFKKPSDDRIDSAMPF